MLPLNPDCPIQLQKKVFFKVWILSRHLFSSEYGSKEHSLALWISYWFYWFGGPRNIRFQNKHGWNKSKAKKPGRGVGCCSNPECALVWRLRPAGLGGIQGKYTFKIIWRQIFRFVLSLESFRFNVSHIYFSWNLYDFEKIFI